MDEKLLCRRLRREFNKNGWVLLLYYGLMNLCVSVVLAVDVIIRIAAEGVANGSVSEHQIQEILTASASNGWGYLLAMGIGALLLYVWKKREFCMRTIWRKHAPISAGALFSLTAVFVGLQAFMQVFAAALEWMFGLFGCSIAQSMEIATNIDDTVSMFLYAAVAAPIGEEILFRGLILRSLDRYGKKFAIVGSAFLFGIFHANIIQTPYAFLVGLILGYVAVEYSLLWAIALHMFNNMFLADFMTRLSRILPPGVGDLISLLLIWSCAIAGVVILIVRRHDVLDYIRRKKIHPICLKSFFTAPGILVLTVFMTASILFTLLLSSL